MTKYFFRNARHFQRIVFLSRIFTLYRKTAETEEILTALQRDEEKTDFERIRCPLCKWRPNAASRWMCADADAPEYFYTACYTFWNTFETRGKCPTCAHQWIWTSCLSCHGWARHEDWYAKNEAL